ncbi:MAG: 23S rRNA (adenine(2503)-C(2))-methyltransferase RlmN, partial [Clostridia bacterium]|nr:23S rRNA (adenine(2503)-C(2))-methyltransferase RlmN [Clostridia bacterium]
MNNKVCISSMTPDKLTDFIKSIGEPAYRAGQIFKWLSLGVDSFSQMTNLSKDLRAKLDEACFIEMPKLLRKQVSAKDGTIKYLFGLSDGNSIESVLMEYKHG